MIIRSATANDVGPLRAMWNRAAQYDPLSPSLWAEKLAGDDPHTTTLAASRGEELVGFVTIVTRPATEWAMGVIKLLAVDPAHQRQGVGSALLAFAEKELARVGAESVRVGESPPNYLTPGVDLRYESALNFFTSHGYEPFAQSINLTVDLDRWHASHQPAGPLPEGVVIRRATPEEVSPVEQMIMTHWPPWWGEVAQALANQPVTLLVAWRGSTPLGFAAHDANNRSTGWFGPMGTIPDVRGQGIGVSLLHHVLDDMHRAGYSAATIPWVGPVEFYARHAGATLSRTFQRFQKTLTSTR